MPEQLTPNDIYEAIKCFIELGGAYKVNSKHLIENNYNNELVEVDVGHNKTRSLRVFGDNMMSSTEYIIFTPFAETLGVAPEREWFFDFIRYVVSQPIQSIIKKIIDMSLTKEADYDDDYDKLKFVEPFFERITEKTRKEFEKIGSATNFIDIAYDRKTKVSYIKSCVFDKDFMATFGNKISKKSWTLFQEIINTILNSENIEEEFRYKATIIGMPRCDSFLHVAVKVFEVINEYMKLFLKKEFPIGELLFHVDRLEQYHKAGIWFISSTSKKKKEPSTPKNAPWRPSTPMSTTPEPTFGKKIMVPATDYITINTDVKDGDIVIGEDRPIGVLPAQTYGNPISQQPSYMNVIDVNRFKSPRY